MAIMSTIGLSISVIDITFHYFNRSSVEIQDTIFAILKIVYSDSFEFITITVSTHIDCHCINYAVNLFY